MIYKVKRNFKANFKKSLLKITRESIEAEDLNRKWENDIIFRNVLSSVAASGLISIWDSRNEILKKTKRSFTSNCRTIMEYNVLKREYEKEIKRLKKIPKLKITRNFKRTKKRSGKVNRRL
jgi:hypothetical protein